MRSLQRARTTPPPRPRGEASRADYRTSGRVPPLSCYRISSWQRNEQLAAASRAAKAALFEESAGVYE